MNSIEGPPQEIFNLKTFVVTEEFDTDGVKEDVQDRDKSSNLLRIIQSKSLADFIYKHVHRHNSMFAVYVSLSLSLLKCN